MKDYFALLGQQRRPDLDAELLKARFHQLSNEVHPDRFHTAQPSERDQANQQFANLNAAYNCLRDPKTRLQHLLELELGSKPSDLHEIPPDLAGLFMNLAGLCRRTDSFLQQKDKTDSALLKARLFVQGQEFAEQLMTTQKEVASRRETVLARLKELDQRWDENAENRPNLLNELQFVWRLLGFFARWGSQIEERLARLAM